MCFVICHIFHIIKKNFFSPQLLKGKVNYNFFFLNFITCKSLAALNFCCIPCPVIAKGAIRATK